MIARIGNVHILAGVYRNSERQVELNRATSRYSKLGKEAAAGRECLDSTISRVHYVDIVVGIANDAIWIHETSVNVSTATKLR
jgi:hypothetical protein